MAAKPFHIALIILFIVVSINALAGIEEIRALRSTSTHLTTRSQLPMLPDDEQIRVFYLESPLFKHQYGNTFSALSGFHGGIGFSVISTKQEIMLEYYATISVLSAVFPQLGANNAITWNNGASVDVDTKIDAAYWTRSQYIGTITGKQFNEFACWAPTYLSSGSNRAYQLFNVYESWPNGQRWLHASTCVDFVWECFETLHDIAGVDLAPVTHPRHDFVNFYSNQSMTMVDDTDPVVKKGIYDFYDSFNIFTNPDFNNRTIAELIELIYMKINGVAYIYIVSPSPAVSGGKYYKVDLSYPYIGFEYATEAMPTGVRDPTRIPNTCPANKVPSPTPVPTPPLTDNGIIAIASLGGVLGAFVVGFGITQYKKKPQKYYSEPLQEHREGLQYAAMPEDTV